MIDLALIKEIREVQERSLNDFGVTIYFLCKMTRELSSTKIIAIIKDLLKNKDAVNDLIKTLS